MLKLVMREESLCYVYFDGAQAEARIVGWEARIDKWKEQFERARLNPGTYDAHIALASEMFNVRYDDVPKHDYEADGSLTLRAIAKRCRHGLNYRMQAAKLAEVTKLSLADATDAWHAYHRTTPELMKWWDEVIAEVRQYRKLVTCKGRVMPFYGHAIDEDLFDSVIAFKPQSTLGDHVCEVQWKSQADDDWPRYARIPYNNHDSLTAMCRERDVMTVARIMKKHMEAPLMIHGDPLIIPSDFAIALPDANGVARWSNLTKIKVKSDEDLVTAIERTLREHRPK